MALMGSRCQCSEYGFLQNNELGERASCCFLWEVNLKDKPGIERRG